MAEAAAGNPCGSRLRSLVIPREHGAWGILLIPLVTGAAVGLTQTAGIVPLLLFTLAALSLFCLRTPVESLLGTTPMRAQSRDERRAVAKYIAVVGVIAVIAVGALLWEGNHAGLISLGVVAGLAFVLQTFVRRLGRRARMAAQLIGAAGLTSTAAGAYYVTTGAIDGHALAVWFVNWMFAGNQVHFVQLCIRASKVKNWKEKFVQGRSFFAGQIVMILVLAASWRFGSLPGMALLAFAPVVARGIYWFFSKPEPLRVHRLGITELAHALVFGVLVIAAFHLSS